MDKKNFYTILFVILGVVLVFIVSVYSGRLVKSSQSSTWNKLIMKQTIKSETSVQNLAVAKDGRAVLSFQLPDGEYKIGDSFKAQVVLNSQDQVAYGADVLIDYDQNLMELQPNIPNVNEINQLLVKTWGDGKIVFSYLASPQASWLNETKIVNLVFIAKQPGQADLRFVFNQGDTNDCNVAGEGGKDILTQVHDARFNILP